MPKVLHILGIIIGYGIASAAIIVGLTEDGSGFEIWKFFMVGIAFAVSATIAIIDGARAMPSVGWFKAKAKFEGLSDLGFILIFAILLVTLLVFIIA